jgi:hypothetical protein
MKAQNTEMESRSRGFFQYASRLALSGPGKFLLALAVIISLTSITLLTRADQTNEEKELTGNWMVTVTRLNPAPGQAPTVLSLATYFEDGNFLQEGNDPGIRSTGRGKWERTGHQQFTQSFINFRFDAARTYLGTRIVTSTITLSDDGSQYQGDAVAKFFDASGNLVSTALAIEVAQRLF